MHRGGAQAIFAVFSDSKKPCLILPYSVSSLSPGWRIIVFSLKSVRLRAAPDGREMPICKRSWCSVVSQNAAGEATVLWGENSRAIFVDAMIEALVDIKSSMYTLRADRTRISVKAAKICRELANPSSE